MSSASNNGICRILSSHSVDETVKKLQQIIQAKGVTLFALVDHSGEAAKAGMEMPNTKLLIFGNPMAGTPVMLSAPSMVRAKLGFRTTARNIWRKGMAYRLI